MMHVTKRGKKRLIILASIGVVGLAGLGTAVALRGVYQSRLVDQARENGLAAHAAGDYEAALTDLSYALSHEKNDLEGLLAFAEARAEVEEVNGRHVLDAIGLYRAALRLDDDNRVALEALLELYQMVQYRAESKDMAERLLALDDEHIDALTALLLVAYRENERERVLELAHRLHGLQPGAMEWPAFAIDAWENDDVPYAAQLEGLFMMTADWTGDGRYVLLAGQVLLDHERRERRLTIAERDAHPLATIDEAAAAWADDPVAAVAAITCAEHAARLAVVRGADDSAILDAMLGLLDLLDLPDETSALLAATAEAYPDAAWVYAANVRRAWRGGAYDRALEELAHAEERLGAASPELLYWRSIVMHDLHRFDERDAAVADLRTADLSALAETDRARFTAWCAVHDDASGRISIAAARDAAASSTGQDPVLQRVLGAAYARAGEDDLAVQAYQEAVRRDRYWIAPRIELADLLLRQGRPGAAFRLATNVFEQQRDRLNAANAVTLLQAWLRIDTAVDDWSLVDRVTGRRVGVVGFAESLHAERPNDATFAGLLAEAYLRTGETGEVAAMFERALVAAPNVPMLVRFAEISERHRLGAAARLLAYASTAPDPDGLAAAGRASLMIDDGAYADALALLDSARGAVEDTERFDERTRTLRWTAELRGADDPEAVLRAILTVPGGAEWALAQAETWEWPAVAEAAIAARTEQLGDQSPEVLLQRARRLLEHDGSEKAIADAIRHAKHALEIAPESRYGLLLMSTLLMQGDEKLPEQAIEALEIAINLYPGDLSLYPRLITLLQQTGAYGRSEMYLERMMALSSDRDDFRRIEAHLLTRQGDEAGAVDALRSALGANASEADHRQLAALLVRLGRHDEAEATFRAIVARPDASADAALDAAAYLSSQGRYDDAVALLNAWTASHPGAAAHAALGRFAATHRDRATAESALATALAMEPNDPDAWEAIAQLQLALGDGAGARQSAEIGLGLEADHEALQGVLVSLALADDGAARDAALARLGNASDLDPAVTATVDLVRRVRAAERVTEADLDAADRLVERHADFTPAWTVAISLYVQAGNVDAAIDLARRGTMLRRDDAELPLLTARLMLDAGAYDDARGMLTVAGERSRANGIEHAALRAELELADGHFDAAWTALAPFTTAARTRGPAFIELVIDVMQRTGRAADAEALASPQFGPEHAALRQIWLQVAGRQSGATAEAMLETLRTSGTPSAFEALQLASEYARLGRRTARGSALDTAEALLGRVPDDATLQTPRTLVRAAIAVARGDDATAEPLYRAVLARESDHPVALNNLANLLRRQGECTEAIELARHVLALRPTSEGVMDTLVQAMICAESYADADSMLRRGLEGDDDHVALNLSAARLAIATGDRRRAERALAVAVAAHERTQIDDHEVDATLAELRAAVAAMSDDVSSATTSVDPVR